MQHDEKQEHSRECVRRMLSEHQGSESGIRSVSGVCQRHQKIGKMKAKELRFFLFSHAFTRCNTTSAIHHIGRVSIFKKLQNVHLAKIANVLYEGGKLPEDMEM